jgi:hypothetical protein
MGWVWRPEGPTWPLGRAWFLGGRWPVTPTGTVAGWPLSPSSPVPVGAIISCIMNPWSSLLHNTPP